MTGDQSFYSRERAEMRRQVVVRAASGRAASIQIKVIAVGTRSQALSGGRPNTIPACRVPHARGLAMEQAPRCSSGCRILTKVLITTHGIRDIPEELGKKNSNRTYTLRAVPIARFQRFACKLLECRMGIIEQDEGSTCWRIDAKPNVVYAGGSRRSNSGTARCRVTAQSRTYRTVA